jgi:hypothetical protein
MKGVPHGAAANRRELSCWTERSLALAFIFSKAPDRAHTDLSASRHLIHQDVMITHDFNPLRNDDQPNQSKVNRSRSRQLGRKQSMHPCRRSHTQINRTADEAEPAWDSAVKGRPGTPHLQKVGE